MLNHNQQALYSWEERGHVVYGLCIVKVKSQSHSLAHDANANSRLMKPGVEPHLKQIHSLSVSPHLSPDFSVSVICRRPAPF